MEQTCSSCFYRDLPTDIAPCIACLKDFNSNETFAKWIRRDLYIETTEEENEVFKNMTESLLKTGVKFDIDKPQWTLVPFEALNEVVEVLTIGAKKYAPDNWKIVPKAEERYIDATFRHLVAWSGGEKKDLETGKSHLAHAICCLLFLLWFEKDATK